ncbi:MAG: hypothetical protein CMJ89_19170 [Planctomycetes bacterium]|jgi:predicted anti-sigma-YlaC factor YlaD|nr:hypothetical protein [Planctomycetota bacterium]
MKDPDRTPPESGCERVRGRLEELLDGGLDPLEEARDQGHLEACCDCRRERESWESFLGLVRRAEVPGASAAGEVGRMQRRLDEGLDRRFALEDRARRRVFWSSVATAAAALLVLVGVLWWAEGSRELSGARELSRLEISLPPWGELFSQIGSLGRQR